ncbi:MAG: hypothetical protein ACOYUZ_05840 [Patescibacteria group bacterium]
MPFTKGRNGGGMMNAARNESNIQSEETEYNYLFWVEGSPAFKVRLIEEFGRTLVIASKLEFFSPGSEIGVESRRIIRPAIVQGADSVMDEASRDSLEVRLRVQYKHDTKRPPPAFGSDVGLRPSLIGTPMRAKVHVSPCQDATDTAALTAKFELNFIKKNAVGVLKDKISGRLIPVRIKHARVETRGEEKATYCVIELENVTADSAPPKGANMEEACKAKIKSESEEPTNLFPLPLPDPNRQPNVNQSAAQPSLADAVAEEAQRNQERNATPPPVNHGSEPGDEFDPEKAVLIPLTELVNRTDGQKAAAGDADDAKPEVSGGDEDNSAGGGDEAPKPEGDPAKLPLNDFWPKHGWKILAVLGGFATTTAIWVAVTNGGFTQAAGPAPSASAPDAPVAAPVPSDSVYVNETTGPSVTRTEAHSADGSVAEISSTTPPTTVVKPIVKAPVLPMTAENLLKFFKQKDPAKMFGKVSGKESPGQLSIVCDSDPVYDSASRTTDVSKCKIKLPESAKSGTFKLTAEASLAWFYEADPSCFHERNLPFAVTIAEEEKGLHVSLDCKAEFDANRSCYDYSNCTFTVPQFQAE